MFIVSKKSLPLVEFLPSNQSFQLRCIHCRAFYACWHTLALFLLLLRLIYKAVGAKDAAAEAVTGLKVLRNKGNATSDEIDAARKEVKSTMKRTKKLAIAVVSTGDDAQVSAQRKADQMDKVYENCVHEQTRHLSSPSHTTLT